MRTDRSGKTLQFARDQGPRGITARELGHHLGTHHGSASGALSSLHRKGELVRLTQHRDGQSVYVLPDHLNGRALVPPRINRSNLTEAERAMVESYRARKQAAPEQESASDDRPQSLPEPEPGTRWERIPDFQSIQVGDRIAVSYYDGDVWAARSGKVAKIRGGFAYSESNALLAAYRFTMTMKRGSREQDTRPEVGWWRQTSEGDGLTTVWAQDADASLIGHTVQFTTPEHGSIDTVVYGVEKRSMRGAKVGHVQSSVSLLLLDEQINFTWYEIPPRTRLVIDAE